MTDGQAGMTAEEIGAELSGMEPIDEQFSKGKARLIAERAALVQAVRNLLDGKPEKEILRELMLENDGWLPINKETVEIEAGVDRRRFSGPLSDHPELSDLLKRMKPTHGVSRTTTELLNKRSERIRVLEARLTAARSAAAAQCLRIEALSVKLKSAQARIRRLERGEASG